MHFSVGLYKLLPLSKDLSACQTVFITQSLIVEFKCNNSMFNLPSQQTNSPEKRRQQIIIKCAQGRTHNRIVVYGLQSEDLYSPMQRSPKKGRHATVRIKAALLYTTLKMLNLCCSSINVLRACVDIFGHSRCILLLYKHKHSSPHRYYSSEP